MSGAQDESTGTIGSLIDGRYRVTGVIGRGGMATVYRALDETLHRQVALKLFARDVAGTGELRRETSEVRLLASLNHHALVTLFDANVAVDASVERAYFVMELIEGPTLRERIDRGPIDPLDVAAIAADLAEALHVVHANGVVHRDIKPANVLLAPSLLPHREFTAKLADFGIAYLIDSTRLTTPGTIIGTASYLSPEQASGQAAGPPADIYALGLVLLEALTGARAFPGSMVESVAARLTRDPEIPASVGPAWAPLLASMTRRAPDARPSALEVAVAAHAIANAAGGSAAGAVDPMNAAAGAASTANVVGGVHAAADESPAPTRVLPAAGAPAGTATTTAATAATAATTAATVLLGGAGQRKHPQPAPGALHRSAC